MDLSKILADLILPHWAPILGGLGGLAALIFAFFKGRAAGRAAGRAEGAEAVKRANQAWVNTRLEPKKDPELERLGTVDQPKKADLDALARKVEEL